MKLSDLEIYDKITIQCHDNPDADTLASGYGLYCYFRSRKKDVRLVYSGRNMIQKSNLRLMTEKLKLPVEYVKPPEEGDIRVRTDSRDFDSWYEKRTAADGRIDFHERTRNIYNLIRGVAAPFPGAFAMCGGERVTIWRAQPFDEMIDFSAYAPGEVIDVFDGKPVVRTVDGSLLIDSYESGRELKAGDILQ